MIRSSVGSSMFQHLYAEVNGRKTDLLKGGKFSCAFFVTAVLSARGLIESMHATVIGTLKDLERFGWVKIDSPCRGCILVWESIEQIEKEYHEHIGFYLGNGRAISNSSKKKVPVEHNWTFGRQGRQPKRRVIAMYGYPEFLKDDD